MKRDILALSSIAFLVIIFFFRLFWPEANLIVTPDFGRSDAWHFSFATKLVLSESLKRNELPLWEPRMGMGFPLFAEGQVGALFLPNLLLLRLITDPVVAYNATYVVTFLILGWGMYAWLRVIGCSRLAGLFGAITVIFSGQTIPRLPHHTLLQSLSMTPLILALAHTMLTKKHHIWISLFSFALSQQLFTGSPQPVLLTLLTIGIYAIFSRGSLIKLSLGVVLGIGIAAIQLLPSAEMLAESTFPRGFSPEEASYYSFPLVHLKTLISPFILGNPKFGTYPPFTAFDGSIFWENNLFIGILPIVLLVPGFMRKFFAASLLISFLLMLGQHSPLYLLYSVWPLNLFRVPSRFAWIFVITLISLASTKLSKLSPKVTILLIAVQTIWLMTTWWDYHAIQPARIWLKPSPLLSTIDGPVRTIGSERIHNNYFLKDGWNGNLDQFQFLRNVPAPNSNLYWNIQQTEVYAGRFLKRPSLVELLLGSEIKFSDTVATISSQSKKLLSLYHAAILVSALPLSIQEPLPTIQSTTSGTLSITAYRNPEALLRAYLTTQSTFAPTLSKAAKILGTQTVVHDEAYSIREEGDGGSVEIKNEIPTRVTMQARVTAKKAILVFGDTYYPGWQAMVDGKPQTIFPVNIKERGVILSEGAHEIIFQYQPKSVLFGAWISILSIIVTGYPAFLALFRKQT